MGLFVLVLVVFAAIALWQRQGRRFAVEFATLVANPVVRGGLRSFFGRAEEVGGEFQDRPVVLVLHRKQGLYRPGYLILAMRPRGGTGARPAAGHIQELVGDSKGRQALSDLEREHHLEIAFEEGWLKATWAPAGFFIFPGPFDSRRWQAVLQQMWQVTASIESPVPID